MAVNVIQHELVSAPRCFGEVTCVVVFLEKITLVAEHTGREQQ